MRDLSKTEIRVNDELKLVVPSIHQVDELVNLFQSSENLEFIGKYPDWPHNPNLKERLTEWINQSSDGVFLPLLILHGEETAGICRLLNISYEHEKVEFGYILLPKFTRKGIATAAVKAMLEFAFNELCLNRVELIIDSRNTDSIRLAKRLDFTYEGTLRQDYKYKYSQPGKYSDGMVFSILKSEYKS